MHRGTVIGIDPGERELFRVVNASAGRYFDVSVDGEPLDLVALDGLPLDTFPGAAPVQPVRDIVIAPAGRAEFVVAGAAQPTVLRSSCYVSGDAGDRDPAVVLADLRGDGNAPRVLLPVCCATFGPQGRLAQPACRRRRLGTGSSSPKTSTASTLTGDAIEWKIPPRSSPGPARRTLDAD